MKVEINIYVQLIDQLLNVSLLFIILFHLLAQSFICQTAFLAL